MKEFKIHCRKRFLRISLCLLTILLFSCDYESEGIFYNSSAGKVKFSTDKKIDRFYKNSVELGFSNNRYYYELEPNSYERLFYSFNAEVSTGNILFNTLSVMTQADTFSLNGKTAIFSKFDRESRYTYKYEIK